MDGNLAMSNVLEIDDVNVIEAAYLSGFEPSEKVGSADEELKEATEFLTNLWRKLKHSQQDK